ncbi:hypothetical protein F4777DRAFT_188061 [Nemania sp. FL0916]|nr:hypothetical protein F4777DRAFT_188061 [Nemania sp. FL0916]
MAEPSPSVVWSVVPLVGAVSLALGVVAPIVTTHTIAYYAAPREISAFVDAIDSSIQENESYDGDVAKVTRLEDKVRLDRLLREIQKQGDDLREELNRLVVEDGGTTLRTGARMLWAAHRKQLEERVRRLDMLRMRFLVIFMGIVATGAGDRAKDAARNAPKEPEKPIPPPPPLPPPVPRAAPMRRLTTQTMGYSEKTADEHRTGWFGVVAELQRSPILRQRHASIEAAMRSPSPMSPMGSPTTMRPIKETTIPEKLEL